MNEKRTYINNGDEASINLKDLLIKICKRWYLLLAAAVVFAALLGGYKYIKDKKNSNAVQSNSSIGNQAGSNASKEDEEELEAKLTDIQLANVNKALSLQKQIDLYSHYRESSILMKINPLERINGFLKYYVYSDDGETDSIKAVEAYNAYICSDEFREALIEKAQLDTKAKYIAEVVKSDITLSADSDVDSSFLDRVVLTITISGADKDTVEKLADETAALIEGYEDKVSETAGSHHMDIVGRSVYTVMDTSLSDTQQAIHNKIVDYYNQKQALTNTFKAEQKTLLSLYEGDIEKGEDDGEGSSTVNKKPSNNSVPVSISKKYVLLGGVLGVFFACGVLACIYIFNGKLHTEEDIKERYRVPILGNKRVDTKAAEEERAIQLDLITANIIKTCEKEKVSKLFVTSSLELTQDKKNIDRVTEALKAKNIEAKYGEKIFGNVASFEQMSDTGNVIIVEKLENSKLKNIDSEMEICGEQKANVLGIMLFS